MDTDFLRQYEQQRRSNDKTLTYDVPTLAGGFVSGSGSANRIAYWASATALTYDNDLRFDGTNLTAINDLYLVDANHRALSQNVAALTYYVSPTGSDSNDGTSGSPFLTIQHAINQLPRAITSPTVIAVSAGTYAEHLDFAGISVFSTLSLLDQSTSGAPLSDDGTATAGAATTLTDAGKSWTTNFWAGAKLFIYAGTGAGQIRDITSNTGTVLTISSAWTTNPDATSFYCITGLVTLDGNALSAGPAILLTNIRRVIIRGLWIDRYSQTTSSIGSIFLNFFSQADITRCYFSPTTGAGIRFSDYSESGSAGTSLALYFKIPNISGTAGVIAVHSCTMALRGCAFVATSAGVGVGINADRGCLVSSSSGTGLINYFENLVTGVLLGDFCYGLSTASMNYSGCTTNYRLPTITTGLFLQRGAVMLGGSVLAGNYPEWESTANGQLTLGVNGTAITAGLLLGKIQAWAKDTSTTTNRIPASIRFYAPNTIAADINPGQIQFWTTPTGVAGVEAFAAIIDEAQKWGVGTAIPAAREHIVEATLGNEVARWESTATNDDPRKSFYQQRVATTNATQTTAQTIAIPATTTVMLEVRVIARRTGGTAGTAEDGAGYIIYGTYKNVAGTATLIGAINAVYTAESVAGYDATINVSGGNVLVQVTGIADTNITWHIHTTYYSIGS